TIEHRDWALRDRRLWCLPHRHTDPAIIRADGPNRGVLLHRAHPRSARLPLAVSFRSRLLADTAVVAVFTPPHRPFFQRICWLAVRNDRAVPLARLAARGLSDDPISAAVGEGASAIPAGFQGGGRNDHAPVVRLLCEGPALLEFLDLPVSLRIPRG